MANEIDPFGGLTGDQRDAYAAITNMLEAYNLSSLAPTVFGFIQQGYSSDTISVLLQNTEAYKQRFSANEARRQKGLPVLSPAEYLAVEQSYRQIMSTAGLPPGYYDQPDDFTSLLANDVSPTEVQQRVQTASSIINNIDPNVISQWEQFYTRGDIVAYALDPERATQVLQRQASAAVAAAAGQAQGVQVDKSLAEQIGSTGLSDSSIRQGMGTVSTLATNGQHLAAIYGGTYDAETAANEVFFNDASATEKRRRLASQERGSFTGSSGLTSQSLSTKKSGQL